MAGPEERTSGGGLIRASHFNGVVGQGGAEVGPPSRFAVVTVGARVGQHVRPVVAHFDGERVSVAVGSDRQVPVGTCVAAAPDLVAVGRRAPQQCQARVRVVARSAVRVNGGAPAGHRCHERARHRRFDGRPPLRRLEQGFTDREEPRPPFGGRAIEDQGTSVVSIPVAGRSKLHVDRRRDHVEHAGEQGPKLVGQGTAGPFRFHGGHDGQFDHEAVVFEGHLTVDAARECVPPQLLLQDLGRLVTPASTLGEPVEGKRRHQEAGGLGDHVVVGRRPPAAEGCEILLVPPDLSPGRLVTLEELRCLVPSGEQSSCPDPGDQPEAGLDPARPVHAGEERILSPPRAEVQSRTIRVALIAGEREGCCEDRHVMHARQFPNLLHVPGDILGAVVDLEAVVELRRPSSRDRIEEPVRVLHVLGARTRGGATFRP